jgi:putative PIN family toxin of toxin-antitoxin system
VIATLDANILASSAIAPAGGMLAQLFDRWKRREYEVAISEHIYLEMQRALNSSYFQSRLSPSQIADFLTLIRTRATIVPITVTVQGVATHPEDDLVLATAVSAPADYLVTGDRQLLRLGMYQGVTILRARNFIAALPSTV